MSDYKKRLKKRMNLFIVLTLVMIGFDIYNVFFVNTESVNVEILSFQAGIAIGIVILSVVSIIRIRRILQDEKKMQLEYNRENDERYKAIRAKAGVPIILVNSILMVVAGIVAGYFSITVFWTLIVTAMCQMLISIIVKFFYMRKM